MRRPIDLEVPPMPQSNRRPTIDSTSAPLTRDDERRLRHVERSLREGLELQDWWRAKNPKWNEALDEEKVSNLIASRLHPKIFHLTEPSDWKSNVDYGFFDEAQLGGRTVPVMGCVIQRFFDSPALPIDRHTEYGALTLDAWIQSLEGYIIHHYLQNSSRRIGTRRRIEPQQPKLDRYLQALSWYPDPDAPKVGEGFVYHQLYYNRERDGSVGKFPEVDATKTSLMTLTPQGPYRWITARLDVNLHSRKLNQFRLGPFAPSPSSHDYLRILHRGFVCQEKHWDRGHPIRFGLGYAFLNARDEHLSSPIGFIRYDFMINPRGQVISQLRELSVRRPMPPWEGPSLLRRVGAASKTIFPYASRLPNPWRLVPNPTTLAHMVTGGRSQQLLGISQDQYDRFLLYHVAVEFAESLNIINFVWRSKNDWRLETRQP